MGKKKIIYCTGAFTSGFLSGVFVSLYANKIFMINSKFNGEIPGMNKIVHFAGGIVFGIYMEQTYHMPSIRILVDLLAVFYFVYLGVSPDVPQIQQEQARQ